MCVCFRHGRRVDEPERLTLRVHYRGAGGAHSFSMKPGVDARVGRFIERPVSLKMNWICSPVSGHTG